MDKNTAKVIADILAATPYGEQAHALRVRGATSHGWMAVAWHSEMHLYYTVRATQDLLGVLLALSSVTGAE